MSFVFSPPHSMFCSAKMHFGEKHEYPSSPVCLLPTLVGRRCLFLGHQSLSSWSGVCPTPGWAKEGSCPYRVPISDHPHPPDGAQRWRLPARRSCRNGVLQCPPPGSLTRQVPLQCTSMARQRGRPAASPCRPSGPGSTRPSLRRCRAPRQGGVWGGPSSRLPSPVRLPTAQAGRVGTRLWAQLLCSQLGGHRHRGAEVPPCVQHQPAQHQGAGTPHRPQSP